MVVCNPSHFVSSPIIENIKIQKRSSIWLERTQSLHVYIYICIYIYMYVCMCVCARVNHKISLSLFLCTQNPLSITMVPPKIAIMLRLYIPCSRVGYELISGGGRLESKHHPFISSSPSANPLIPNHCPLDHQLPGREAACHVRGTACAAQSPRRGACRRWPPSAATAKASCWSIAKMEDCTDFTQNPEFSKNLNNQNGGFTGSPEENDEFTGRNGESTNKNYKFTNQSAKFSPAILTRNDMGLTSKMDGNCRLRPAILGIQTTKNDRKQTPRGIET